MQETNWDEVRRYRWGNGKPPPEWDQSLQPISINGLGLFAINPKGELYWDGERIQTEVRFSKVQKLSCRPEAVTFVD